MLRAAAAGRDITPALEGDFFGYVRPDLRAKGVALRLRALALVLDDGRRRIALLTLDLGAPLVTREILQRLGPLGYDRSNPLIAATHTHAGPSRPGPWVAQQAAEAVAEAGDSLRGARAGWGEARVDDANQSRSLEAHLANHGLDLYPGTGSCDLDPDGADHPRDVGLRLLRVEDDDGGPLAAWAHFSAHPTTFVPANTRFSADYPATARWHFRAAIRAEAEPAPPTAMLANGAEGDLITRYDEVNQHALADRIGARVADAMRRAWDAAGPLTGEVAVDGRTERVVYAGQRVAPGRRVASRAWFGLPFLGGGRNGPSWLYGLGLEGRRRPRPLAGPVHGRKLVVAPAPWPPHAHVTVVRVADRLLMGVPGEPTVEAGRRMRAAALAAVRKADPDTPVVDALVVGLAQSYRGYFTTPEEYDQQHYEGGHTVFGRHTSLVVERAHARLAAALAEEGGADAAPDEPGGGDEHDDPPPAVPAPVGLGAGPTRVLRQPPPRVSRFETLALVVAAPPRGRARPVDAPLLVLQRRTDDGGVAAGRRRPRHRLRLAPARPAPHGPLRDPPRPADRDPPDPGLGADPRAGNPGLRGAGLARAAATRGRAARRPPGAAGPAPAAGCAGRPACPRSTSHRRRGTPARRRPEREGDLGRRGRRVGGGPRRRAGDRARRRARGRPRQPVRARRRAGRGDGAGGRVGADARPRRRTPARALRLGRRVASVTSGRDHAPVRGAGSAAALAWCPGRHVGTAVASKGATRSGSSTFTIGFAVLDEDARSLVTSGAYGHLATIDPDGRPHVTLAWFDVDGDDLVSGTLFDQRKLANLRRDPRAVVSFESDHVDEHGLRPYLVVRGPATVTEGGAPELLQRLAHRYLGPDVTFPPMPDPPPGYLTRIAVESVSGVGPWAR